MEAYLEVEGSILAGAACFFLLFCNLIIFHFSTLKLLFRSKNTVLDPVQCSFCIYYMLLLAILVLFVFNSCYCIWLPCKLSANVTTVLLVIFCIIRPTFSLFAKADFPDVNLLPPSSPVSSKIPQYLQ